MDFDLEKTLDQIENTVWGEPDYPSYLVITCHQLRKKPLKDFTVEDLRIMIGQNISLDILIPMAFERLKQNIMAEGDCYSGDLLNNILTAESSYWIKNPILHRKLTKLFRNNFPSIEKLVDRSITRGIFNTIKKNFEEFSNIQFD